MTMDDDVERNAFLSSAINRRDILKAGVTGMLGVLPMLILPKEAKATSMALPRDVKEEGYKVVFRNEHTGEGFDTVYRVGNKYIPEAFDKINVVLRDFRTGDVFPIDPRAIDIIYMIQQKMNAKDGVEVLSGYRSPHTNAMLRRTTDGVAANSLHLTGQAIDIRIPGYSIKKVRDNAIALRAGGVGFYPTSDFVHVDTGRVRHW